MNEDASVIPGSDQSNLYSLRPHSNSLVLQSKGKAESFEDNLSFDSDERKCKPNLHPHHHEPSHLNSTMHIKSAFVLRTNQKP